MDYTPVFFHMALERVGDRICFNITIIDDSDFEITETFTSRVAFYFTDSPSVVYNVRINITDNDG